MARNSANPLMMLKQRNEQVQTAVKVGDVVICMASFFLAYGLRKADWFSLSGPVGSIESVSWLLAASLAFHFVLYSYFKFYESLRLKTNSAIIGMVLRAFLVEFVVLGALIFLLQAKDTSRYFFGLFLGLNYTLVLIERIGARALLTSIRRRGYNFRHVLILGTGLNAKRMIAVLRRNRHWGYLLCGLLREVEDRVQEGEIEGVPILGVAKDLGRIVEKQPVDEVMICVDRLDAEEIAEQVALCEKLGIPVRLSLGLFDLTQSKVTFNHLDHIPVVTFYTTLMTPLEALLKRAMDIGVASIGLLLTAVLYPWIAWRIRKESPGPIIFKQYRVGENGRAFKCYKFRTMSLDAEIRKSELAAQNQMEGPLFKLERDPRVFPFGALLRRTSLDELPQFFNILRGDMSVVGTRPPTPDEVRRYRTHYRRRLSIRPGLTGLWQVSGRNQIRDFEDVLKLDLKYIDSWSIWLDLQIIARTVWVVLFGRGAY